MQEKRAVHAGILSIVLTLLVCLSAWAATDIGEITNVAGKRYRPSQPQNMFAVPETATLMALGWQPSTSSGAAIDRYDIYWCQPSPCDPTLQTTSVVPEYDAASLSAGVVYDFQVVAVDSLGRMSLPSAKVAGSLNDLVAFYKFESGALGTDSSLNPNNATVSGNVASVAGKVGNAATFDGAGDYLTSAANAKYAIPIMSTQAWWNCDGRCGPSDYIMTMRDAAGNDRFEFRTGTTINDLVFTIWTGNASKLANATGVLSSTEYQLVTATYDGTTLKVYVNDVLVKTFAGGGLIDQDTVALTLGARTAGTNPLAGLIDEARLYSSVLHPDYIARQYVEGIAELGESTYSPSVEQYANSYASQGPYAWENNSIGISSTVPAPFTAISRDGKKISVWGRDYYFENGLFPTQVRSQNVNLFYAAPKIFLRESIHTLSDQPATYELISESATQAKIRAVMRYAGVTVTNDITLEYDGFIRFDLAIDKSGGTLLIRDLYLLFPLNSAIADHYVRFVEYDFTAQTGDWQDLIASAGYVSAGDANFAYVPMIWVGKGPLGVEYMHQTNLDLFLADTTKAAQIINRTTHQEFRVNFITKTMRIDAPLHYSFALIPTPTRPPPPNWRTYYLQAAGSPPAGALAVAPSVSSNWTFVYPPVIAQLATEVFGLPAPAAGTETTYQDVIDDFDAIGAKVLPYVTLFGLSHEPPEFAQYTDEWESAPALTLNECTVTGQTNPCYRPMSFWHKSAADFMLYKHQQHISTYGNHGAYFDNALPLRVSSMVPKVFPAVSPEGKLYYALFGGREMLKRYYTMTQALDPNFLILHHAQMQSAWACTYSTFCMTGELYNIIFKQEGATVCSGEWCETDDYLPDYAALPYALFPGASARELGFAPGILPQVEKNNTQYMTANPTLFDQWTRALMGPLLVHGTQIWWTRHHIDYRPEVTQWIDKFGSIGDSATRIGVVKTGTGNDVDVAGYKRPGKLLLIFHNYDTVNTDAFTYDIATHPDLAGVVLTTAKNARTDANLTFTGTTVSVSIPPKDFLMVVFDITG